MGLRTLPEGLPGDVTDAVGDTACDLVASGADGVTRHRVVAPAGGAERTLVTATGPAAADVIHEVTMLGWVAGRIPTARVIASGPMLPHDGRPAGYAALVDEPPGTPASGAEHWADPAAAVAMLADALRLVHDLVADGCPYDRGSRVRLAEIRERRRDGRPAPHPSRPPYDRVPPDRLLRLAEERHPPDEDPVVTHGAFDFDCVVAAADRHGTLAVVDWRRAGLADRHVDLASAAWAVARTAGPEWIPELLDRYGMPHPDPVRLDYFDLLHELG